VGGIQRVLLTARDKKNKQKKGRGKGGGKDRDEELGGGIAKNGTTVNVGGRGQTRYKGGGSSTERGKMEKDLKGRTGQG